MLHILPNLLDPSNDPERYFPPIMKTIVCSLSALVAESEKAGRRFLALFMHRDQFSKIPIWTLNEHTSQEELKELVSLVEKEKNCGLVSDCGLPCLADPGSQLIFELHKKNMKMQMIPGPSSIIEALLLSGLNAQSFCFHGYLPRDLDPLKKRLVDLQARSKQATQIWIEAPYRSQKMLMTILETLQPQSYLCVAKSLSLPNQGVKTASVSFWKKHAGYFNNKEPAVFLLSSEKTCLKKG